MTSTGRPRRTLVGLAVIIGCGSATFNCHSLKKLEDCSADLDCERGTKCSDRHYCEKASPLRIGVVLSLTGNLRFSAVGAAAKEGLELGLALLNAGEPRVLDRGLELVFEDDQSDVSTALSKVQSLASRNVAAIIGPITSQQTLASRDVTKRAELLHVAPLAGAQELGEPDVALGDRFLFQLTPTISNGSPLGLVKWLVDEQARAPQTAARCKNSVVIYNDDVAGQNYNATFQDRFRANGMCVRASIAVPLVRKKDYVTEVDQLFAKTPDCVVLSALPDVAGSILEEVERRAVKPTWRWFGTTFTHTPQFLEAATVTSGASTRSRAEGFVGADVDYAPNRNQYRELLVITNQLHESRGEPPVASLPSFSVQFLDALFLVALALEKANGASNPTALRDAFLSIAQADDGDESYSPGQVHDALRALRRGANIDYSGGSSDIELVEGGFLSSAPISIWRVVNGAFVEDVVKFNDPDLDAMKSASSTTGCD